MTIPYSLQPTTSGKVILSGIQPSGALHLGNYLGALTQWVALQEHNEAYFCIVDEHAITVPYEPAELPSRILDAAAIYLAAGLDPARSVIFVQSHVPAHTELTWLLSTVTAYGELTRMTQFKDKARAREGQGTTTVTSPGGTVVTESAPQASLGLFAYPVLMAADILLYQADIVPVGEDQTQHLELTRSIADRFNKRFGPTFTIPKAYLNPDTARIMSLTDPTKKMSKSGSVKSYVALTDSPAVIRQKIMAAVTETEPVISFSQSGPAVQNLLRMYEVCSGEAREAIEQRFADSGYKEFKEALAEQIIALFGPLQERYEARRVDSAGLKEMLAAGAASARVVAEKTLQSAKARMGLVG